MMISVDALSFQLVARQIIAFLQSIHILLEIKGYLK